MIPVSSQWLIFTHRYVDGWDFGCSYQATEDTKCGFPYAQHKWNEQTLEIWHQAAWLFGTVGFVLGCTITILCFLIGRVIGLWV